MVIHCPLLLVSLPLPLLFYSLLIFCHLCLSEINVHVLHSSYIVYRPQVYPVQPFEVLKIKFVKAVLHVHVVHGENCIQ